ncbi:twin transmembrane helix small protein [Brevundimonas sp. 2R-24]|uniref:Twin transmembrane helix small protein n=1 Tax=Peiella sedimenti TaxID=3061083 RepID=A0ABT8SNH6_9CAUL|nr:twin transmembrane helix small protein [Caulobacteraceae bacterium XZ-24]
MAQTLNILILVAIAAVTVTLGFGIYALYRGGEFGRSHSNKLMRLRIVLQATAIALLAVAAFISGRLG